HRALERSGAGGLKANSEAEWRPGNGAVSGSALNGEALTALGGRAAELPATDVPNVEVVVFVLADVDGAEVEALRRQLALGRRHTAASHGDVSARRAGIDGALGAPGRGGSEA